LKPLPRKAPVYKYAPFARISRRVETPIGRFVTRLIGPELKEAQNLKKG
jgi:hypothetical protein